MWLNQPEIRVGRSLNLEALGEEWRDRESMSSEAVVMGRSERVRVRGEDGRAGLGMAGGISCSGGSFIIGGARFEVGWSEADFALSRVDGLWNIFESFEEEGEGGCFELLEDI